MPALVIMGHSFGGTFAQLFVGNGLDSAGVSIDGAGVKAMPFSEIRSTLPVLKNPAHDHRAVPLTPEQFHYAFTNTLTEEASQLAYDRYAAPTPGKILFQGGLANFTPHTASQDRTPPACSAIVADYVAPTAARPALRPGSLETAKLRDGHLRLAGHRSRPACPDLEFRPQVGDRGDAVVLDEQADVARGQVLEVVRADQAAADGATPVRGGQAADVPGVGRSVEVDPVRSHSSTPTEPHAPRGAAAETQFSPV